MIYKYSELKKKEVINGITGKNHYIAGTIPFAKEQFKKWYEIIKKHIL